MNLKDVYESLVMMSPNYEFKDALALQYEVGEAINEDSQPLTRDWLEQWEWEGIEEKSDFTAYYFDVFVLVIYPDHNRVEIGPRIIAESLTIGQFKALCEGLGVELKAKSPK